MDRDTHAQGGFESRRGYKIKIPSHLGKHRNGRVFFRPWATPGPQEKSPQPSNVTAMASVRKRPNREKAWQVRWRDGDKMRSRSFSTRNEAILFRGRVDAHHQRDPDSRKPRVTSTVAEWCETTINARSGITERTRRDYKKHLDNHLGDLGLIPIDQLTRTDIGMWVNDLAIGLSPKSVKNIHGIVSSCLQDAVQDGHIGLNHAKGIRLPTNYRQADEIHIPSQSDFDLIRSHLDPHWHPLLNLLLGTGMRWGEATALTVGNVNAISQKPSIRITQAWKKAAEGGWEIGPPKTKRSKRTIAITPQLRDELLPLLAGKPGSDYVIQTKQGRPVNHAHFYNLAWRPAVFAAQSCDEHRQTKWQKGHDLPAPCGCAGTLAYAPRIHSTRHFHVSLLIAAGVSIFKVSRRLGHESTTTTSDTYGHLLTDSDDEIVAALTGPTIGQPLRQMSDW